LAARIDQFLVKPTNRFGEKFKEQVEERLTYLNTGTPTAKNLDVMEEVLAELKNEDLYFDTEIGVKKNKSKKKSKKGKIEEEVQEKPKKKNKNKIVEEDEEEVEVAKPKKKAKKL